MFIILRFVLPSVPKILTLKRTSLDMVLVASDEIKIAEECCLKMEHTHTFENLLQVAIWIGIQ